MRSRGRVIGLSVSQSVSLAVCPSGLSSEGLAEGLFQDKRVRAVVYLGEHLHRLASPFVQPFLFEIKLFQFNSIQFNENTSVYITHRPEIYSRGCVNLDD